MVGRASASLTWSDLKEPAWPLQLGACCLDRAGRAGSVEDKAKACRAGSVEDKAKAGRAGSVEDKAKAGRAGSVEDKAKAGRSSARARARTSEVAS